MLDALVTVHDSALIAECEASGRFAGMPVTYLFVGPRPVDVAPDVNVIVARDYDPNYEQYVSFYDFTGWFVVARHLAPLLPERFATLQYDMRVSAAAQLTAHGHELLDVGGPVSFVAGHRSAGNWMLMIPGFEAAFNVGMAAVGVDPAGFPDFNEWPTTQGMLWCRADFCEFMAWFEPLFEVWHADLWAGHLAERSLAAWMMASGRPFQYLGGLVVHEGRDVHGTCSLMAGRADVHAERAATFGR